MADNLVPRPNAAIAIASSSVSTRTAASMKDRGSNFKELKAVTATKPSANHGTVIRRGASVSLVRDRTIDRMTRNGASIMTRTILVMTAVSAAASPMARPAATT